NQLKALMSSDINYRQINWQRLYDVNRGSFDAIHNVDGIPGNTVSGKRSHYIIEERIINTRKINLNSVLNTSVSKHVGLTFGASYQNQINHYYKKVNDLLGGEFYVDINQFAERDYPNNNDAAQNNLLDPN